MVKISLTIVSALLVSGTVCATPLEYLSATTLSFTSDGPILHETPATPDLPPAADDRITLSDTGKNGWYIAPNFAINLLSDFNNNNIVSISFTFGRLLNCIFLSDSKVAANIGNEAFFEPEILTCPLSIFAPKTSSFSMIKV